MQHSPITLARDSNGVYKSLDVFAPSQQKRSRSNSTPRRASAPPEYGYLGNRTERSKDDPLSAPPGFENRSTGLPSNHPPDELSESNNSNRDSQNKKQPDTSTPRRTIGDRVSSVFQQRNLFGSKSKSTAPPNQFEEQERQTSKTQQSHIF